MPKYKFQIKNLKAVLKFLGSAHKIIPVVSVVGSNGKGSTSCFLESIFRRYGKKTGLYTSPHILDFKERIKVAGRSITNNQLKAILRKIRHAEKSVSVSLTKFELMTAVAIQFFYEQGCDISVMEAGLGGRFDATSVCEKQLAVIVCDISLEHTDYLGNTIEKIALEKAQIIKKGSVVVDLSNSAVVKKTAAVRSCEIFIEGKDYTLNEIKSDVYGFYTCNYESNLIKIKGIHSGLRGQHQLKNMSAAVTAAVLLGIKNEKCIKDGLKKVKLAGRLELFQLSKNRKLLVDAAHNPASINALCEFVETFKDPCAPAVMIIGVYKDKNYIDMVKIMEKCVDYAYIFRPDSSRALDTSVLASQFSIGTEITQNFKQSYEKAVSKLPEGAWIIAAGSFSVVKPAFEEVLKK